MLKKTIRIEKEMGEDYSIKNYIPILTLLNNLVANAVEAIGSHGNISLKTFVQEKDVFFIITDDGKGILEEDKDLVFEPGFTTKFSEVGIAATGIGLSHVRDIVLSLGGNISMESQGRGCGAQVTVVLPTAKLKKEG